MHKQGPKVANRVTDDASLTKDLDELFARLAGGDRACIGKAFSTVYPIVHEFCSRLLGNSSDADDATQQALERVFERIATYDVSRHALPWVLGIAAWEIRTVRRRHFRQRKRAAQVEIGELEAGAANPESDAMSKEVLSAIESLVDRLPALDRDVLRDVMHQELALVLEFKNDSTFRKRKERALDRLRSLLRNLGHVR